MFSCMELYKLYIVQKQHHQKNDAEIESKKMVKNNLKNYKKAVDNSENVMYN